MSPDYPPQPREPSSRGLRPTALALLGAVALVLGTASACSGREQAVRVVRVVDGDTVVVARGGERLRVRLLGVDTPETGREGRPGEPFSRAASRFARERLAAAERVELEVAGDRVDAHGRTLGFLWLHLPGRGAPSNLSEELIEAGLGRAIRRFEYPGRDRFLRLEQRARAEGRGLWRSRGPGPCPTPPRKETRACTAAAPPSSS